MKREVAGPAGGTDVLLGDRVDVLADVPAELLPRPAPLALVLGLARPAEVLEGELAVDRDQPVLDEDHGVDDDPVAQRMLRRERAGRQDLRERLLEEHLAERAAQLRRLQEVLEPRDVARELLDLLGGLVQAPEAARRPP